MLFWGASPCFCLPGDTPVPSPTATPVATATTGDKSICNLHPDTMDKPFVSGGDVVQRKGKRRHDAAACTAMPDDKGEEKKAKIDKAVRRSSLWTRRRSDATTSHLEVHILSGRLAPAWLQAAAPPPAALVFMAGSGRFRNEANRG